jgi:hypothetical protein
VLLFAPAEATSSAPSTLRCTASLSIPTSRSLHCPCSRDTTHRRMIIRQSRHSPRRLRSICLATPSMTPGDPHMSTLLRPRPLRDPLLQSITEPRVRGPRPRVTRVAPCSGSHPCRNPLLNPHTTRPPTTARRPTHTNTIRLSGTSTVPTVVAVTAHSDTLRTSCPPDMDHRLSLSNCPTTMLPIWLWFLHKLHIRPSIHLSDSSVQKFLSASPLHLGPRQLPSGAHSLWLLDIWLADSSLHIKA